jgi:hypothetical protein
MKEEGLLARLIDLLAVDEEKVELVSPTEEITELQAPVVKKDETFYIDVMEEVTLFICVYLIC